MWKLGRRPLNSFSGKNKSKFLCSVERNFVLRPIFYKTNHTVEDCKKDENFTRIRYMTNDHFLTPLTLVTSWASRSICLSAGADSSRWRCRHAPRRWRPPPGTGSASRGCPHQPPPGLPPPPRSLLRSWKKQDLKVVWNSRNPYLYDLMENSLTNEKGIMCMRYIDEWWEFWVPRCNTNPIYAFLFWKLRGLSPYFHIHVSVRDLHIPRIGPHISCRRIGRSIVRI